MREKEREQQKAIQLFSLNYESRCVYVRMLCTLHSTVYCTHMEFRTTKYTFLVLKKKTLAKAHEMSFVQIQAQKVNTQPGEFEHHLIW